MNTKIVNVAVTGAAGQIGYALLFRIAAGEKIQISGVEPEDHGECPKNYLRPYNQK